jgi:hypothetical protein
LWPWWKNGKWAQLSAGAAKLYVALVLLSDRKARRFSGGGLARLAASCGGKGTRSASRWLKELCAAGMVRKQVFKRTDGGSVKSSLIVWLNDPPKGEAGDLFGNANNGGEPGRTG